MPRAKRGFKARRRRNRILKAAKGFRGKRSAATPSPTRRSSTPGCTCTGRARSASGTSARSGSSASTRRRAALGKSYSKLIGKPQQGRRRASTARCSPRSRSATRSAFQAIASAPAERRDSRVRRRRLATGRRLFVFGTAGVTMTTTDDLIAQLERLGGEFAAVIAAARRRAGDPRRPGAVPRQEGPGLGGDEGAVQAAARGPARWSAQAVNKVKEHHRARPSRSGSAR